MPSRRRQTGRAGRGAGSCWRSWSPSGRPKSETASRLRGRIENVLDWASARQYRTGDNPARWKGCLDKLLPAPSKVKKVEHHRALPIDSLDGFMKTLRGINGMSARALEFAILTAARSGEVRGRHGLRSIWVQGLDRTGRPHEGWQGNIASPLSGQGARLVDGAAKGLGQRPGVSSAKGVVSCRTCH